MKTQSEKCNNYYKTKLGIITRIYGDQNRSSKDRGHIPPTYTKQELKEWLFNQHLFHSLFETWTNNMFDRYLKPSVDRLDDSKGYSFSNIQLMTWGENKAKGHRDHKSGKILYDQKPVLQFTLCGELIKEFISTAEAARQTIARQGNISSCCNEKYGYKTAGGFIWKFKKGIR